MSNTSNRKIEKELVNVNGLKRAQITWIGLGDGAHDRSEVALYIRANGGIHYQWLADGIGGNGQTAVNVAPDFLLQSTDTDDFPRYAIQVKLFHGSNSASYIIEDIIKL